jgi:acetylornithine deacetylase/succinyl-diaminopimelate desuccinylase-like protein
MFDGDQVTIDGFHDDVAVTEAQRDLIDGIPFDEEATKEELGLERFATDTPFYERMLLEPTMTINGIVGGYTGEGSKTIIPHRASAKMDFRLVPDQDPDQIAEVVTDHVTARRPEITVDKLVSFPPMQTSIDTPAAPVIKRALQDAWGMEPVEMPLMGGSLPAAYFQETLDVPVLVVPYGNPDENNHSPNENLELSCLKNGIRSTARFLQLVSKEDMDL